MTTIEQMFAESLRHVAKYGVKLSSVQHCGDDSDIYVKYTFHYVRGGCNLSIELTANHTDDFDCDVINSVVGYNVFPK